MERHGTDRRLQFQPLEPLAHQPLPARTGTLRHSGTQREPGRHRTAVFEFDHELQRPCPSGPQEALHLGEHAGDRDVEQRGVDHVERQVDARGEAVGQRETRPWIGGAPQRTVEVGLCIRPEPPAETVAWQCQRLADAADAEYRQRIEAFAWPVEQRQRQFGEARRQVGRFEAGTHPGLFMATACQQPGTQRRRSNPERGPEAEFGQSGAKLAEQTREPAEQFQAACNLEQHARALEHHRWRELRSPAGHLPDRRCFACLVPVQRGQSGGQRAGRCHRHARMHAGRTRPRIGRVHERPVVGAIADRQRQVDDECSAGIAGLHPVDHFERQVGQVERNPEHGRSLHGRYQWAGSKSRSRTRRAATARTADIDRASGPFGAVAAAAGAGAVSVRAGTGAPPAAPRPEGTPAR